MSRLKFITAFFAGLGAYAQTRIRPGTLDTKQNITSTEVQNLGLWGSFNQNFFTRISLGANINATVRQGPGGSQIIELNATTPPQPALTIPATRVSTTQFSVPLTPALTNRSLQVFYNGLFMTPGFDYTRDTAVNSVTFLYPVDESTPVITFVYGV